MTGTDLNNLLFSDVFDFTNQTIDTLNSVKVEDCGEFSDELSGYYIAMNRGEIESLRLILQREFPDHKDAVTSLLDSGSDEGIIQCIQVCYPNQSLTEKFVERYGSIENLITYGATKSLEACDARRREDELLEASKVDEEEEEDEEMIKELEEKLSEANKKIEEKDKEIEYFKSKYPDGDLDDDVLQTFVEIMQTNSPKITESILGRVISIASGDNPDEMEIKRIIGVILDSLQESGELQSFIS